MIISSIFGIDVSDTNSPFNIGLKSGARSMLIASGQVRNIQGRVGTLQQTHYHWESNAVVKIILTVLYICMDTYCK